MLGISIGLVFAMYILGVISEMGEQVKALRYLSVFTLADSRGVITNTELKPACVIVSLILFAGLIILSLVRYQKKELV